MLVLQVLQGPDRGLAFELPAHEPQLIGRSSEALPITDTTVSRRHAELTPDDGAWWIHDLSSANGTFVNGRRIKKRTRLEPGDQVRCGSTLLLLAQRGAGTGSDDDRPAPIRLLGEDELDVTIEQRDRAGTGTSGDPNEDSMVLASPDPAQAAIDHLRVIYDLVAATAEAHERGELLERVMDLVFQEFRPDRGFILIGEEPGAPLAPVVVRYREKPTKAGDERIPVSRTIIDHVRTRREGILSTNAMNDDRFAAGDSVQDYGIRSAICVPVATADRVLGVLHIDSQLAHFTFTQDQLRLLRAIGQHVGLALYSIELLESRVRTERMAAMGETVASLSHSVKNILQGLRGGADAVGLALNRDDLAMAREGWPILARNLDRILVLTLNMLAWSRASGLDVELGDLHELVRDVRDLVQRQAEDRGVALVLDLDEDMPPVPFDAGGLHQVLMNLLTNALEAVPAKGGGIITVGSRYEPGAERVVLTVADNGPGLTESMRDHAFEPFHTSKGQRGTGLGLAVSRKLIEQHGGTIGLVSGDAGTTVRVELPVTGDASTLHETRQPPAREGGLDEDF